MSRAKSVSWGKRPIKKKSRRVRSASPETNLLKPLLEAVRVRNLQKVRILIKNGALKSKDITQLRFQAGEPIKESIAHIAIINILHGHYGREADEIFRLLKDNGLEFSPETVRPELFVDSWQVPELFDTLINNGFDVNTQHYKGHTVLMSVMASVIRDDTPFTDQENTDLINRLFDLGAEINIQDDNGLDALMIATGHEAIDEFWYYLYGGGLGNEIAPNPYYVNLLLENLKRTGQRYDFTNTAVNGDDFNGDEYTLDESLDNFRRETDDNNIEMLRNYGETIQLIREYKFAISKPTKSAASTRAHKSRWNGGKKKTRRNKK